MSGQGVLLLHPMFLSNLCQSLCSIRNFRYSLIKKHMRKDEEGKLSAVQHLTASAEAGKFLMNRRVSVLTQDPLWAHGARS